MTATHALFFRNLNLGHAGSPTRDQLESTLLEAGARRARSFQTNGTVLVQADDPDRVSLKAKEVLLNACGYDDAIFVRPLAVFSNLLAMEIFEKHASSRTYRETVTLFNADADFPWELPWTNTKDDVDILYSQAGIALSLIRKPGNSAGSPTAEIERATGGAATTRTRGSIERLLKAADSF